MARHDTTQSTEVGCPAELSSCKSSTPQQTLVDAKTKKHTSAQPFDPNRTAFYGRDLLNYINKNGNAIMWLKTSTGRPLIK